MIPCDLLSKRIFLISKKKLHSEKQLLITSIFDLFIGLPIKKPAFKLTCEDVHGLKIEMVMHGCLASGFYGEVPQPVFGLS